MNNRDKSQHAQHDTVGEKSHDAQPYDHRTADGMEHNYQAANATDPGELAEMAAENLRQQAKNTEDAGDDYRQHDTGG